MLNGNEFAFLRFNSEKISSLQVVKTDLNKEKIQIEINIEKQLRLKC